MIATNIEYISFKIIQFEKCCKIYKTYMISKQLYIKVCLVAWHLSYRLLFGHIKWDVDFNHSRLDNEAVRYKMIKRIRRQVFNFVDDVHSF